MPNYQQLLLTKSNNCGFMPTINAGLYTINQQLLRFYNYNPAIIPTLPIWLHLSSYEHLTYILVHMNILVTS